MLLEGGMEAPEFFVRGGKIFWEEWKSTEYLRFTYPSVLKLLLIRQWLALPPGATQCAPEFEEHGELVRQRGVLG